MTKCFPVDSSAPYRGLRSSFQFEIIAREVNHNKMKELELAKQMNKATELGFVSKNS